MNSFRLETTIAASPSACFERSLSVDAHTESMLESGERAVDGITSGVLSLGDTVTWRGRHFGIPFTMTSAITACTPPNRFVDEQKRSPFQELVARAFIHPAGDRQDTHDRLRGVQRPVRPAWQPRGAACPRSVCATVTSQAQRLVEEHARGLGPRPNRPLLRGVDEPEHNDRSPECSDSRACPTC